MRCHAADGFNREGQRGHIHQQQALAGAGQGHAAQTPRLHGGAQRHTLVRVQ